MTGKQIGWLETTLLGVVDRLSKTATTAAEVESLTAVVRALTVFELAVNP